MMEIPAEQREQKHANRMAKILAMAGWQRKQKRIGKARVKVYHPPGTDLDDPTA
jgi:hypothetical protein